MEAGRCHTRQTWGPAAQQAPGHPRHAGRQAAAAGCWPRLRTTDQLRRGDLNLQARCAAPGAAIPTSVGVPVLPGREQARARVVHVQRADAQHAERDGDGQQREQQAQLRHALLPVCPHVKAVEAPRQPGATTETSARGSRRCDALPRGWGPGREKPGPSRRRPAIGRLCTAKDLVRGAAGAAEAPPQTRASSSGRWHSMHVALSPTRLQTCAEAAGRVGPGAVAAQCCAAAPGLAHRAARPRTPSQSPGTGPRPTRVSGAPAAAPAPGSPRAPTPPTARARRARGRRPCNATHAAGGRGSARARASCSLRGPSSYTYTLPDLTR